MQSIEEMEGILGDVTSQWDPKNDLQGHRRTTRTLTLGIGGTDFPMVRPRRTTSDRGVPGGYPQPPPFRHNWSSPNRRSARGAVDPRRVNRAAPGYPAPPVGSRPRPNMPPMATSAPSVPRIRPRVEYQERRRNVSEASVYAEGRGEQGPP
ncbi:hypothetical protein B0T24DRAFT_241958 [Lasiosphaeria ovina]|uniref:Uncharacterized protein n=1 Tax=Lasiosphaeria ovina TaxID=92902 RepID=A0AAE0KAW4_9PEZI|nr:hypothetical protein B0T24DRAFT_241958 [Lasiosphaeria ovina]